MGAISSGDVIIFNDPLLQQLNLDQASIDNVLRLEQKELLRREQLYRGQRSFPELLGKTIILIDDGIATGATMRAAIEALRKHKPIEIIIAVPVAALDTYEAIITIVDKIICPLKPINFRAVG